MISMIERRVLATAAVVMLVWAGVVGAAISGIIWAVSSLPFWPVFGVVTVVLLGWSFANSARNIRRSWSGGRGDGGWLDASGMREPRRPRGPSPSSAAADPGESTGPSTIL
jgi:hypothetical protein